MWEVVSFKNPQKGQEILLVSDNTPFLNMLTLEGNYHAIIIKKKQDFRRNQLLQIKKRIRLWNESSAVEEVKLPHMHDVSEGHWKVSSLECLQIHLPLFRIMITSLRNKWNSSRIDNSLRKKDLIHLKP